jgi:hypothetical protein
VEEVFEEGSLYLGFIVSDLATLRDVNNDRELRLELLF